ncbi:Ig-like domain-containing protein [Clostridium sp. KNHs216]|uniref:Ig-like domain-containing protein n=1 Tax=Clostridium sp. KNHs216 TaxID=1550235 RepID=UPI0011528AE4|nr:Ig-like domain-containing protein [Clostridium sp. KNHs216]TQI68564.1 Ig-like protein group 2 [Clostridium sp. KNHs216]
MKNKRKVAFLSLFSLYMISVSGISGYAVVTGKVPPILGAISSGVFSSPAQSTVQSNLIHPQDSPDLVIDPGEISHSESVTHKDSSEDPFDPDAKIDNDTNQISYSDGYSIPTIPVGVTTPQNENGASSKPADPDPTPQDPGTSPPAPSSPAPNNPDNPWGPGGSGSSGSGSGSGKTRSITGISLDRTEITLDKGDVADLLIATITPSNATGNKTVTWSSSDEDVATVNSSGQITAAGAGKTEVVAHTSNGKTAVCEVTVLVPATSIHIDSESFQIDKGSSKTLTATITPNDATDREIAWATSNADVLSIDHNGRVTAEDVGTAVITASVANGKIASTCDVSVGISISTLTLDKGELNLIKGTQEMLTATIDPPDTTDDKTVEWSSVNPEIATVDANGNVQAVTGGTTTITAQAGSHVAECRVTVSVPVTGITLSANTLSIMKNATETLTATITPEDATNKKIVWTSSNDSIVSVDSTGKVTAKDFGSAIVTATTEDGNLSAQCTANVVTPVTGISLDKSVISMIRGTVAELVATVEPENATNKNVNWTSSDESIASVDSSGNVTGVRTGTALIRATTEDGGFTDVCAISVTPDTYTITGIGVNGHVDGVGDHHVGDVVTLTAVPDEHYHFTNWTNSSGAIIGTTPTYVINGLHADMTITANFTIDYHTVTVIAGANGSVTGSGSFAYGSTITLTATPDSHYHFVDWSDGNTDQTRTYTVTGDADLTANFFINGVTWTYTELPSSYNTEGTDWFSVYSGETTAASQCWEKSGSSKTRGGSVEFTFSEPINLPSSGGIVIKTGGQDINSSGNVQSFSFSVYANGNFASGSSGTSVWSSSKAGTFTIDTSKFTSITNMKVFVNCTSYSFPSGWDGNDGWISVQLLPTDRAPFYLNNSGCSDQS